MSKVIGIVSYKGGTGKSTTARMLAWELAERGKKVLIIDTDQNSSIATGFVQEREQLGKTLYDYLIGSAKPSEVVVNYKDKVSYIPTDDRIDDYPSWLRENVPAIGQANHFKMRIDIFKQAFDYIIIDTHPKEKSDVVNYVIASCAGGMILIPSNVDADGVKAMKRTYEVVQQFNEYGADIKTSMLFTQVQLNIGKSVEQMNNYIDMLVNEGLPRIEFLGKVRFSGKVTTLKNDGKVINEEIVNDKYARNVVEDMSEITDRLIEKVGI